MKKSLFALSAGMIFLSTTAAFSLTIGEVSVGGIGAPDNLIYCDYYKPSSLINESNLISVGLGGMDMSDYALTKYEFDKDNYPGWSYLTDSPSGSNLWAFDFGLNIEPSFFLLKTGSKVFYDNTEYNYYLFENIGSQRYGVVDLAMFDGKIDVYKISHLTAPVPEPSTLLLLGAGILSLLVYRRKKE